MSKIDLRKELAAFKKEHGEAVPGSNVAALHLWQVDENGLLTRSGEYEGDGIEVVVIPSGKFITPESKMVPAMSEEQWITGFAHLTELPEMKIPMRVSPLIDAPPAPEHFPTPVIERVPDGVIGATGGASKPLALRPDQIDRKAALIDFAKAREERGAGDAAPKPKSKPRTFEEHASRVREEMMAQFEKDRLAQQETETQPARSMAMAPTITEWKGY